MTVVDGAKGAIALVITVNLLKDRPERRIGGFIIKEDWSGIGGHSKREETEDRARGAERRWKNQPCEQVHEKSLF